MKPKKAGISLENLKKCARASKVAYLEGDHFERFSSERTGTDGMVMYLPDCTIVAFRGTDKLKDWRTNCNLARLSYPYVTQGKALREPFRFHRGFLEAWFSVKQQVRDAVFGTGRGNPVFWTGHSLGGALAQLATFEFGEPQDHIYTFGAPRVGDGAFAKSLERIPNRFRIVNDLDIVPLLPPEQLGFSHFSGLYYFQPDGTLIDGRDLMWWARLAERALARCENIFDGEVSDIADHRMAEYLRLSDKAKLPKTSIFSRFIRGWSMIR